jgi:hypothetical protein
VQKDCIHILQLCHVFNQKEAKDMTKTATLLHPTLSVHAQARSAQRAISKAQIQQVVAEGRVIHKQGLRFHYLPKCVRASGQKSLDGLVVVSSASDGVIVSCYRNKKAIHRIKQKSKYLK